MYWWGGNLKGVKSAPVKLKVAHQLVYSAHEYGPVVYPQSWFNGKTTQPGLESRWSEMWAYVSKDKIAPVWVGEFGSPNAAGSLESKVAGSQGQWFQMLVAYLKKNEAMNWTYWDMAEDNNALLDGNWDSTPVSAQKQKMLASLEFKLAATGPAPVPPTATCHVIYSDVDDWGTGFQGSLTIKNTGTADVNNWTLAWTFAGNQSIYDVWSGVEIQNGEQVTISNASYNASIPAGGVVQGIGFLADYGGTNKAPVSFTLNGAACK
jgi:endoglucanase